MTLASVRTPSHRQTRPTSSVRSESTALPSVAPSLTISRSLLKDAVHAVGCALPKRVSLPVLSHILLAADHQALTLTATDLTICAIRTVPAEVMTPWRMSVPGKLFTDVISALPEEPLTITYDAEQQSISVVAGSFATTIKGFSDEEFPHIPQIVGTTITIASAAFATAIDQVAHAAATDAIRPVLEGIHIVGSDTCITLTATDGLRLAQAQIDLAESAEPIAVLVPAQALDSIAPLFREPSHITLTIGDSQVALAAPGRQALVRIIDGVYPDVARVLPTTANTRIVMQTSDLQQALRPIKLFANESSQLVRLHTTHDTLILSAIAAELGDQTVTIPMILTGDPVQAAVNARFLAAALETITTTQVALEFVSAAQPVLLRPVGDDHLLQLIMPITVR